MSLGGSRTIRGKELISQRKRRILAWLGLALLFIVAVSFVTFVFATDDGIDPQEIQPYAAATSNLPPAKVVDLRANTTGHANFDMQGVGRVIIQVPFATSACYSSKVSFGTQMYTCQSVGQQATILVASLEPGLAIDFQAQPGVVTLVLVGGNQGLPRSQIPQVEVMWN